MYIEFFGKKQAGIDVTKMGRRIKTKMGRRINQGFLNSICGPSRTPVPTMREKDAFSFLLYRYSLLQNLLNVDTNRDEMEFCTVGTGRDEMEFCTVGTGRDEMEFCIVGTGVLDGPFPALLTHSII